MLSRFLRLRVAPILMLGTVVAAWSAPPTFRIVDLGVPQGYYSSVARDLNDKGQVVGLLWHFDPSPPYQSYFLWSPELGMQIWDGAGQKTMPNASGLNNRGQVVGMVQHKGRTHTDAFVATKGGLRKLGQLQPGGRSWANDINDSGTVAGQATVDGSFHAFRWTPETGMVDLHPEGALESYAPDINAQGAIAVWYKIRREDLDTDGLFVAADGTQTRLDCLVPDDRGRTCLALGVNNLNQVVGHSRFLEVIDGQTQVRYKAFLWSAATGSIDLTQDSPYSDRAPEAGSINDRGQVVGSMRNLVGTRNPTYWDATEGWHDMMELIDPADPLRDRLTFTNPSPRINRWGHVLVTGRIDGLEHALLFLPVR